MGIELFDAGGETISVGDFLLDDRGKVWAVMEMDDSLSSSLLVDVKEVRRGKRGVKITESHILLRTSFLYKIMAEDIHAQPENKAEWRRRSAEKTNSPHSS